MLKTVSSVINAIGALNYQGTWDASTNTPTLTSGVGTKGDYYVVSAAGNTNLDGTTLWGVGDWAVFNGSIWQKVDGGNTGNFTDLSVSGTATFSGQLANSVMFLNASKNLATDSSFSYDGANGRLGIGTSSPGYKLDVNGAANTNTAGYYSGGLSVISSDGSSVYLKTGSRLYIQAGSTTLAQMTNDGNFGLGVTPSAWSTGGNIQIGGGKNINATGSYLYIQANQYYNAGDKYVANGFASQYAQEAGAHVWRTAPSGTAGNAITFTQAMTLDASGNLGIGVTSPTLRIQASVSGAASTFDGLNVTNGTAQFRLGTTGASYSYAGVGANEVWLYAAGTTPLSLGPDGNAPIKFVTNGAEQMRLTSTGLGIGTSSPGAKLEVNAGANTDIRVNTSASGYLQLGQFTNGAFIGTSSSDATAGVLRFGTGGTAQMRLDTSGNLGLGVTPSAWGAGFAALQIQRAAVSSYSDTYAIFSQNNYADKYIASSVAATKYQQTAGTHAWFYAAAGTAGNAITFTQAMTLDASGQLGIGTSSPSYKLDVSGTARISNGGDTYIGFGANKDNFWTTGTASGKQVWRNSVGTEFMQLDSSGNLLIGTTTAGASKLVVNSDSIQVNTAKTPASATATGTTGQIAWDANYIYVCTATNTWKRVAIATW